MGRLFVIMLLAHLTLGCDRQGGRAADVPVIQVLQENFARVVAAEGSLRPVRVTPVSMPSDVEGSWRITWLAADGAVLKKGDLVARFDDTQLKDRMTNAESGSSIAQMQRESVSLRTENQERQRSTLAAERDLTLSRAFERRDRDIYSSDEILEDEITQRLRAAQLEYWHKSAPVDQRLGRSRIELLDVERKKTAEVVRRTQKELQSLQLTAPHEGVLTLSRKGFGGEPLREGDSAYRTMKVAEVSLVEQLEAEVFVLEADAAGLAKGRKAEVIIEAQPERTFTAAIKEVESVPKQLKPQSPTQYFGVVLTLEHTALEAMKPGQRVRARLHLHEQRALVLPRPAIHERDGGWIVYRREKDGTFTAVAVKLGPATAARLSIESGLQEGELVALRDPGKAAAELLPGAAQKQNYSH